MPSLSSRLSISVSTRLTKNDATEAILARSWPLALACSRPAKNASMTSPYRSREKISVTFTLMPSASTAVIAGSPSWVAGILISVFGRSTIHHRALASAMVGAVLRARRGSTSIDTRPSRPSVRS